MATETYTEVYNNNPAGSLDGTEILVVTKDGTSAGTTTQDIADLGGGGGGGLSLESYQNSAMSAAVMAYVFRDEEDNIVRVYEPVLGNDIQGLNIDDFPFDNSAFRSCITLAGCQMNYLDKSLSGLDNIFLGTESVLDIAKGGIGITCLNMGAQSYFIASGTVYDVDLAASASVGPDIFHGGINVVSVDTGSNTFSVVGDVTADVKTIIYKSAGSNKGYYTVSSATENAGNTDIVVQETILSNDTTGKIRLISVFGDVQFLKVGVSGIIYCDTDLITIDGCEVGTSALVHLTANVSNKNFINIAGTTYELGESSGTVTATPV